MNFTDLRILKTQEKLQNALLELLKSKQLKEITVKEICDLAGISRNAFYQHYGYKESLYEQMVATATERIRNSLTPMAADASQIKEDTVSRYAGNIIDAIYGVRELVSIMLKGDDGVFLRQLTDLIFVEFLNNALPFFNIKDSKKIRLFYEFQSAGTAAFIIRWIVKDELNKKEAAALLTAILRQTSTRIPDEIRNDEQ